MSKKVKILLAVISALAAFALLLGIVVLCINARVKGVGNKLIIDEGEARELSDVDCILVLGCLVRSDGRPSDMLADRLTVGCELYENRVSDRLLFSGDHGQHDYDEVSAMKDFALERNVVPQDIFLDHAGFSTYESIYRAKEIFGAKKIVIVTQKYHLYRALYIAKQLGMEAYGVASDLNTYRGQSYRDAREVLARCKDVAYCTFRIKPTYLGDPISLDGSGEITH